jgi:hypothetical protein
MPIETEICYRPLVAAWVAIPPRSLFGPACYTMATNNQKDCMGGLNKPDDDFLMLCGDGVIARMISLLIGSVVVAMAAGLNLHKNQCQQSSIMSAVWKGAA